MPYDGVKSLRCGVFIDSLTKSITSTVKDVNKVKCEGCDEDEAATMHCVDCGQNFGAACVLSHRKMKMSSSHQLVPLHDALKGKVETKRIPWCKKHATLEINTYCKTCKEAVCPKCGIADHRKHDLFPLDEIAAELQDEVAGFSIVMKVNEEEAKKAAKVLNTTLRQIEKKQGRVESEMEKAFATLHSDIDLRHAQLLGEADNVKKVAMKEKDEAEYAAPSLPVSVHSPKDCSPREPPLRSPDPTKRRVDTFSLLLSSLLSHSLFVPLFRCTPDMKP